MASRTGLALAFDSSNGSVPHSRQRISAARLGRGEKWKSLKDGPASRACGGGRRDSLRLGGLLRGRHARLAAQRRRELRVGGRLDETDHQKGGMEDEPDRRYDRRDCADRESDAK